MKRLKLKIKALEKSKSDLLNQIQKNVKLKALEKSNSDLLNQIQKHNELMDFVHWMNALTSQKSLKNQFGQWTSICIPSTWCLKVLEDAKSGKYCNDWWPQNVMGVLMNKSTHVLPEKFETMCKKCSHSFTFPVEDVCHSWEDDDFVLMEFGKIVFRFSYLRYVCLKCNLLPVVPLHLNNLPLVLILLIIEHIC